MKPQRRTASTQEFTRKTEGNKIAVFDRNQHFRFRGTPAEVDVWIADHATAKRQQREAAEVAA